MSINTKQPPIKETVGAQYLCFNVMDKDGKFTTEYETEVIKTKTVKQVKVTDTTDSAEVYASGEKYYSDTKIKQSEIEVEYIAFPAEDMAKARGDEVDTDGLILSGGDRVRPYFAYGKVVKLTNGHFRYDWYPKCKLTENSDSTNTGEDKFKEQTDTFKITAYPFDEKGTVISRVSSEMNFPEGLTEDKFFAKPILNKTDLAAAITSTSNLNESSPASQMSLVDGYTEE